MYHGLQCVSACFQGQTRCLEEASPQDTCTGVSKLRAFILMCICVCTMRLALPCRKYGDPRIRLEMAYNLTYSWHKYSWDADCCLFKVPTGGYQQPPPPPPHPTSFHVPAEPLGPDLFVASSSQSVELLAFVHVGSAGLEGRPCMIIACV